MRKSSLLIAFIAFFIFSSSHAQQMSAAQQKKVNDLFKSTKVLYFEFVVASSQEIGGLAKIVSVDGAKGTKVRAHATKEQFSKFIVKNYPYTVMKAPAGKGGKSGTKKPPAAKKKAAVKAA